MKKYFFKTILVSLIFVDFAHAYRNSKEFRPGSLDLDVDTNYFHSDSNFDSSGSVQNLNNSRYYQLINTNITAKYYFERPMSLYSTMVVSNSEAKNYSQTKTNSSISDAVLGFEYGDLVFGGFRMIPEVSVLFPVSSTAFDSGTDSANSEGVTEVNSKVTFQKRFTDIKLYTSIGYDYRDGGRSDLLTWVLGSQYYFSKSRLGLEANGYQSVIDDKDVNNKVTRTYYNNLNNAGSLKFGAVNPSLIDSLIYFDYKINKQFLIGASGGVTLAGNNSADAYHAGLMLTWNIDFGSGSSSGTEKTAHKKVDDHGFENSEKSKNRKSVNNNGEPNYFLEETQDGVDQDLFKPKSKKSAPVPTQDDLIQKQLDDTEMNIELKAKKK